MKFYFAPLEGVTGYIYRNAYEKYFGKIDKYFTPFVAPTSNMCFTSRELNDILPEHNKGINVIPQILTNNSEYFIYTMNEMKNMGYDEVNLNLGCPSGTVVAKGRGSGFLAHKDELDRFLDAIFSKTEIKISIKTRIGVNSSEDFNDIMNIYNKYPLEELIIHPRIQKDFYKNTPNMDVFKEALKSSKNPVCYNGDIFNFHDYKRVVDECSDINAVMLGRGIITNPGLIKEITDNEFTDKKNLKKFHDQVYLGYKEILSGDKNVLFKMKEFWFYMINIFEESEKIAKKIKKAKSANEYEAAVLMLFNDVDTK
ncbi:tRNA-dihydrouridine synthase family protein (plasmid) [Clostridium butyricum]|uniref:tRNA dihydrouridine synthase n=1 Tax=Clostridium butyricum TaxID=1492 RepID=UPI001BADFFFA|nr:tRNA-dihydrouridine synthase family protein [Clostridium butyricum]QUF85587.1 tRNA-dihydrouridine synthase family protein [Clostridium butyricum]